jgi:hypothetical protein
VPNEGTALKGGHKMNSRIKSVQNQTKDRNHSEHHWEAGEVKFNEDKKKLQINNYGVHPLRNGKSKINYGKQK